MRGYSICLIGNSHLAAPAQAWRADRLGALNEVSLVFFGARAGSLRLNLEGGVLLPADEDVKQSWRRTSGGQESIVLRDHDAFVLYGLCFNLDGLLSVVADYGTAAELAWGPIKHLVSGGCMRAILHSGITRGIAFDILEQIRPGTTAPVLLCPMPFRSESKMRAAVARRPRLSNPEFLTDVVRRLESTAVELCEAAGGIFVPQDKSTTDVQGFTKAEFVRGGESWSAKDGADDNHMNARYGAIMLASVLRRLDSLSGGQVLDSSAKIKENHQFCTEQSNVGTGSFADGAPELKAG